MSSNLIGKRLDGFEIIRVLGRGGMGVVYKAHEMTLQRVIALKVLPQHLAENKEFITRFYREARAAAQLNHNNVVTIYRVGEDDGHHYIAMEYLKGRELTEIIKERKQIDVKEAVDIARQVASALAAAHELGILHRDIKPHNVMLDEQGRVKVMDFGIAKLNEPGDGTHGITMTGQLLGTPAYMSPEQCKGTTADARSDIYSLGVVLYQSIAGKVPYTGETPLAVMRKIVEEPLPDIRTLRPDVPEAVAQILDRALNKEPSNRYANAAEMEEDCKKFLAGQDLATLAHTESSLAALPVSEPAESFSKAKPAGKSKTPVMLVAAICLVAMLGVGGLTFMKLKKRNAQGSGGDGTEIASGDGSTGTGDGKGSQAIVLPAASITPKETPKPTETPRPTAPPTAPPSPSPKPNRKPSATMKLSAAKASPDEEIIASFEVEDEDGDPLDFSYRLNGSPWIKLKGAEVARTEFKVGGFKEGENVVELRADDGQEIATARSTVFVDGKPKPAATQAVVMPVITKAPMQPTQAPRPGQQAGPLGDALKGHSNNVTCVAVGGGLIISGSQDNTAIIWDLKSGEKRATLSGHSQEVSSVALSPDGRTALTGSRDNTARVWDAASGKELRRFENHTTRVNAVAFTADGKSALSASDDGQICRWEPGTGSETARLTAGKINCASFSADGKLAVTGNASGAVQLWDIDAKAVRSSFQQDIGKGIGHARAVFAVSISADGRRALSGGQDAKICVWDTTTGEQRRSFEGHKGGTLGVAFSADGSYALSGGKDKGVAVWDLDTGDQVQSWFNHTGSVLSVAGAGAGMAVSASADQTARRWRL